MRQLWRSPTLRSAAVLGGAGLGFALANLILARALPTTEYALFTLVVALVNVGYAMAPAGIDGIVVRRHLEAGPHLLRRALLPSLAAGMVFAAIALAGYRTSIEIALLVLISTAAGGTLMVAAGQLQGEQRFGLSLTFHQSPNLCLFLAALAAAAAGATRARLPLFIWGGGFMLFAVAGWALLFRERLAKPHREAAFPWTEALSFAGVNAAGLLLVQLERLVIPYVLPLEELATYGVLAAIVGSLFRVLSMGVGYSLFPRLRAAPDIPHRRRLIAREVRLITVIVVLGSAAIWILTPLVEEWFLAGKYHLPGSLIVAALVVGVIKILNAFTKSTVSALAEPRELSIINLLGWVSVAVAIGAAVIGARWGLAGVIYGVGLGWLVRAISAMYLTARHLRLPATAPVAAP